MMINLTIDYRVIFVKWVENYHHHLDLDPSIFDTEALSWNWLPDHVS